MIEKYQKQYSNLKVIRNNSFHNRYIMVDNSEIYHSGTSINNAGHKTFSINKVQDSFVKDLIKKTVNIIINS